MTHPLDIPRFLSRKHNPRLREPTTAEERRAYCPEPVPGFVPPAISQMEAERREERREKTRRRLARLRDRAAAREKEGDWRMIPEKFREWCPRTCRFVDAREVARKRLEIARRKLNMTAEETQVDAELVGSTAGLVVRHNELAREVRARGGKARERMKFKDEDEGRAAVARLEARLSNNEEEKTMAAKKKSKSAPAPRKNGKMRPGTGRATILQSMDGTMTLEQIAKRAKTTPQNARTGINCLHRDYGIGHEVTADGKIRALFPRGQSLKTTIAG